MHPIDYARQNLVQQLSDLLQLRLGTVYNLLYPTKAFDQGALEYLAPLSSHFANAARELLCARLLRTTVVMNVKLDKNKKIHAEMEVFAIVTVPGHVRAKSFQDFVAGVVDRLFASMKKEYPSIGLNLQPKQAFSLLNAMTGNEPLYDLQATIDGAIRESRDEAMKNGVRDDAIQSFRDKHRVKYTSDLATFLRQNIPPGLLEEEDFQRAWQEFIVADVMEDS